MQLSLVALLSISGANPPSSVTEAPTLPEWPAGLPSPLDVPSEALCADLVGIDSGAGVFLPLELANATHDRLIHCEALPGRCQVRLDQWRGKITPALVEAAHAQGIREGITQANLADDWPWLGMVSAGVGIALMSFAAGVLVGS